MLNRDWINEFSGVLMIFDAIENKNEWIILKDKLEKVSIKKYCQRFKCQDLKNEDLRKISSLDKLTDCLIKTKDEILFLLKEYLKNKSEEKLILSKIEEFKKTSDECLKFFNC